MSHLQLQCSFDQIIESNTKMQENLRDMGDLLIKIRSLLMARKDEEIDAPQTESMASLSDFDEEDKSKCDEPSRDNMCMADHVLHLVVKEELLDCSNVEKSDLEMLGDGSIESLDCYIDKDHEHFLQSARLALQFVGHLRHSIAHSVLLCAYLGAYKSAFIAVSAVTLIVGVCTFHCFARMIWLIAWSLQT